METEHRQDVRLSDHLGALGRNAAQIASLPDLPGIAQFALDLALELTRSRKAFITLSDEAGTGRQVFSRTSGSSMTIEGLTDGEAHQLSWARPTESGGRTIIEIPLEAGGHPIGRMGVESDAGYTAFDETAMTILATQVAGAIEVARLNKRRGEMVSALASIQADLDQSEKKRLINEERARTAERLEKAHGLAIEALLAVSQIVRSGSSLTEFYSLLTASVARLVGADRVLFWQVNSDRTLTAIPGAFGVDSTFISRLYPARIDPNGDDLPSQVVYKDLVFRARRGETSPHQGVLDLLQVSNAISVPWRAGDERLGVVAAYDSHRPEGFSSEDAWLLQMAGLAAGLVWQLKQAEADVSDTLERLRKVDAVRELLLKNVSNAADKARRRFAAELHDDALQKLTAAELQLQRVRESMGGSTMPDGMDQAEQLLAQSEEALRRLLFNVQPPALESPGAFATAIRDRLTMLRSLTGIEASVELDLPAEMPYDVKAAVYREVAEAVSNIEKHAEASKVSVSLTTRDGGIHGVVADDGRGFVVSERDRLPGHLGLLALTERAVIAGGWCKIESEPGAGTTIEFWIPLAQ